MHIYMNLNSVKCIQILILWILNYMIKKEKNEEEDDNNSLDSNNNTEFIIIKYLYL